MYLYLIFFAKSVFAQVVEVEAEAKPEGFLDKFLRFANLITTISPEEWNEMTVMQRVKNYSWSKELIVLSFILFYVVLHKLGRSINNKKVAGWLTHHKEVLSSQFYQFGVLPKAEGEPENLIVSDGATAFTTYATGRVNIKDLTARFRLLGRQNFLTLSIEYVLSFFFGGDELKDYVSVVITPSSPSLIEPFVFAIVNKDSMRGARDNNYFLSLTKTVDSEKLPVHLTFMTESNEVTEFLYTSKLAEAVSNPESERVLEYFAVTDQSAVAPATVEDTESSTRVVLALKFPKTEKEYETSAKIVNAAIETVDLLVSKHWRPEVTRKIRATRDSELKKVQKSLESVRNEQLALKKAEEKRARQQEISRLSPAEQKKIEQREREKESRKQRSKQTRRG